jgi:exodeoxyribonuclease V alpha subunit
MIPVNPVNFSTLLDAADRRLVNRLRALNGLMLPEDDTAFTIVTAALCKAGAEGSLCILLEAGMLGRRVRDLLSVVEPDADVGFAEALAARFLESADAGRFAGAIGTPEAPRPLIRAGSSGRDRLYLHRFYFAERTVAEGLAARLRGAHHSTNPAAEIPEATIDVILRETLEERPLRGRDGGQNGGPDGKAGGAPLRLADKQREALAAALREPVFVLAGGPGTGKTTWTAAWLRAVLRLPGVTPDRVRLCAPTGRAARRLEESLRERLDASEPGSVDAGAHAVPVTTLHALLGYRAFEGLFARGPEDPLDADWILLDEASMADVFLMAALVRAMPPGARLVLAGDPDQLPAVEAGSVLAELLPAAPDERGPVPSVVLDTGHRAHGTLAALAAAVRAGDPDAVLDTMRSDATVTRVEPGEDPGGALVGLLHAYARTVFGAPDTASVSYETLLQRFRILTREDEPSALDALWVRAGRARVLAPLRRGPVSAERANRLLRELLEPAWRRPGDGPGAGFHGAPILVTRNDERAGLSNGDVGLWLETGDGAAVFFPRPNATEAAEGWLRVPVALLPPHELGFASTVHKSQGSEYDEVLLLLPEPGNRLLAREILYTGITRAKKGVRVFASEAALREAARNRLRRDSGLRDWFTR